MIRMSPSLKATFRTRIFRMEISQAAEISRRLARSGARHPVAVVRRSEGAARRSRDVERGGASSGLGAVRVAGRPALAIHMKRLISCQS